MARADAGLTISELARRAGVTRDTISNAERGRHGLQASTLHKLARALGRTPSELLAQEERLAPKAESRSTFEPSFNDALEDERRRAKLEEVKESYREEREGVERYLARWEQGWTTLSAIPEEAVREFLLAASAFYPVLCGLLVNELTTITSILDLDLTESGMLPEEAKAESSLLPLAERYWELGRKLNEAWNESSHEDPPIDFQKARHELRLRRAG